MYHIKTSLCVMMKCFLHFLWLLFHCGCFMLSLVNFISLVNTHPFLHFTFLQHIPKNSWEDEAFWHGGFQAKKCSRCYFVLFFLQTGLKLCNSIGSSLLHFSTHSLLGTGQDCRQVSPAPGPDPILPQPCLCNVDVVSHWTRNGRFGQPALFSATYKTQRYEG